jgi:RimJ/RimL family protein N-acetyltransferase
MTDVLTIETERLRLRPWRDEDLDPYAALCADPDVMQHIADGSVRTRDESAQQLASFRRGWAEHGFGLWCAADRETDWCQGFVGLAVPDFLPEIMPAVEVGWRLERDAWGRGLATEGARAALRFGFESVGLDRIVSVAKPENRRSWNVMEKLGMKLERRTVHPAHHFDVVVYAIDR